MNKEEQLSTIIPNMQVEAHTCFWEPSVQLISSIRSYQKYNAMGGVIGKIGRKLALAKHRFWTVITGAEIPVDVQIGGGIQFPHPNGVVIHNRAKIGMNCMLLQQVTIGERNVPGKAPVIGNNVQVGAGAKILGGVTIGDGARIGANSVVTRDVPAGAIAMGIPAQITKVVS
jgi:serine O-acetyltransferase